MENIRQIVRGMIILMGWLWFLIIMYHAFMDGGIHIPDEFFPIIGAGALVVIFGWFVSVFVTSVGKPKE